MQQYIIKDSSLVHEIFSNKTFTNLIHLPFVKAVNPQKQVKKLSEFQSERNSRKRRYFMLLPKKYLV